MSAADDEILGNLGIEAFVQDGRLTLRRGGITTSYSGRFLTDVPFPDCPSVIMVRMLHDGGAEIQIDGTSLVVRERKDTPRLGAILED